MTAASGILHKEYHEENFSKTGGDFQMVQLWVNLPAKDKMSEPKYQSISNAQINKYELPQNGGSIEVIAGEYKTVKGSASTFTPLHLYNARLNPGAKADFSLPENYNTALLVIEGNVVVNEATTVTTNNFVLFDNVAGDFTVEALDEAIVLVLSGEPINESIAAQGPFVMNTREELMQAMKDYNMGKFGFLKD